MADIQSNIKVNIETGQSLANLKQLQRQISAFHQTAAEGGAKASIEAAKLQQNLINGITATGKFSASIQNIKTSTESFTTALEKNKFSLGEYFRYAGGASKSFGKLFKQEFNTINEVAVSRVKSLQTQYIKLGRDASGAMKAIAIKPLALDMENLSTKTQLAAQKQQILNQLLKQGSTNLLNFGKNTQWAGRQLMVGFTIPLSILGTTAAKTFMEMEAQAIKFKRVYGDSFTATEETNKMLKQVKAVALEFTKYGVAVADTMDMAAKAAATGKTGNELLAQVKEATRLATLGNVDQNQALDTTISLTNAFGVAADNLGGKVNFLNAVENQTVTSIEDLTEAIPKAGPVIKQLGGNVEDLAFLLTAMREGGINASEGANALKSGLAAMINPTRKASDFLKGFGIDLQGIVQANKGDVKGTIVAFSKALDGLDPLNRARAIEQLFGKFQFARISTLLQNVNKEGSQASRVLELTQMSATQLGRIAAKELGNIADSPMYKFQKAIEEIKVQLAPIGELFLKIATPVIQFGTDALKAFNNLGDGTKTFIAQLVGVFAGIGPIAIMTFGLLANGVAQIIKGFTFVKNIFNKASTASTILGETTNYMTQQQIEAAAVAASLDQSHNKLTQTFTAEKGALAALTAEYVKHMGIAGMKIPSMGRSKGGAKPKKMAGGGKIVGPGTGTSDSIPAMLSNGEYVIPAKQSKKYSGILNGIIKDNIPGFKRGRGGQAYSAGSAGERRTIYQQLADELGDAIAKPLIERLKLKSKLIEQELGNLGIEKGSARMRAATQADRAHVQQVDKNLKESWHSSKWVPQLGAENNLIGATLKKSSGTREAYFEELELLKKEGITQKQITEIKKKINSDIALSDKELSIQGHVLRSMADKAEKDSGYAKRLSKTFPTYAKAVGNMQLSIDKIDSGILKSTNLSTVSQARSDASKKGWETRRANEAAKLSKKPSLIQRAKTGLQKFKAGGITGPRISGALGAGAIATGALSMVGGPVGDIAGTISPILGILSMFGGTIAKILPHLIKFAGPIGIAATAIGGIITIANMVSEANKKAAEKVNAFADAAELSANQIKGYGEFFGITPKELKYGSLKSKSGTAITDVQNQQIEDLRKNETFQKDNKKTIKSLKDLNTEDAKTALFGQAQKLLGSGFATDAVQVIIEALKQEAGKTDLELDVKSLSIGTKDGFENFKKTTKESIGELNKVWKEGYTPSKIIKENNVVGNMVLGTTVKKVAEVISPQAKEAAKARGEVFENYMSGFAGQLKSGSIDLKTYNSAIDELTGQLSTMDSTARNIVLENMFSGFDKATQGALSNITDITKKMTIAKAIALGFDNYTYKGPIIGGEDSYMTQTLKQEDMVKQAEKYIKNWKKIETAIDKETGGGNGNGSGNGKPNIYNDFLKSLQARNKTTKASIAMVATLVNKNIDLADATKMASDADFVAAYNSTKSKKKKAKLLKLYKSQLKSEKQQELQTRYSDYRNSLIENNKASQESIAILSELTKKGMDLSDAMKMAADANFVAAYNATKDINKKKDLIDLYKEQIRLEKEQELQALRNAEALGKSDYKLEAISKKREVYNNALSVIAEQEDSINKKYDTQISALDEIANLNDRISKEKQNQLSIADALSRGDIAAAAQAAQQAESDSKQQSLDMQKAAIEKQRQAELEGQSILINGKTYTKKQLEDLVKGLDSTSNRINLDASITAFLDLASQFSAAGLKFNVGTLSQGGMVPKYFAKGGFAKKFRKGTDIVPAMLTPGEFVMSADTVRSLGVKTMSDINNGNMPISGGIMNSSSTTYGGDSVYNYSINLSVAGNSSNVADEVIRQIKILDSQRIKGSTL